MKWFATFFATAAVAFFIAGASVEDDSDTGDNPYRAPLFIFAGLSVITALAFGGIVLRQELKSQDRRRKQIQFQKWTAEYHRRGKGC